MKTETIETRAAVAKALKKREKKTVVEIADEVGTTTYTARRALAALVQAGVATCEEKPVPGRGKNPMIYAKA
jgi:predicted ArsR family transcriptional regulator